MMFWKKAALDERFVMHRLYSTRFAAMVTAVFVVVWFLYEQWVNDVLRTDLMLVLIVMAVAKLAAMLYYRFTN
jgi:hypothetical protein